MASFVVSSNRETFVKENRWCGGGGYRRISRSISKNGVDGKMLVRENE